jgi:hypothetical protein
MLLAFGAALLPLMAGSAKATLQKMPTASAVGFFIGQRVPVRQVCDLVPSVSAKAMVACTSTEAHRGGY